MIIHLINFLVLFQLFSCSNFNNKTASVFFKIDGKFVNAVEKKLHPRTSTARNLPENLTDEIYFDVYLKGDFGMDTTVLLAEDTSVVFDSISVGSSIYVESTRESSQQTDTGLGTKETPFQTLDAACSQDNTNSALCIDTSVPVTLRNLKITGGYASDNGGTRLKYGRNFAS